MREVDESMAHPIPAHDPLPKTPLRPHLPRHDAQPLVRRVSILALHAHLEHFHRTGKNGIRGAGHSARRGGFLQGELSERRDDPFRDTVGGKEQRVDTCDPDEGTGHPFVIIPAGERRIGDEERRDEANLCKVPETPLFAPSGPECPWALSVRRVQTKKTGIEAGKALTNMPSITKCNRGEVVSLIHGGGGEGTELGAI